MSEARTVKGLILQINLGDKEERFLAQDLLVAKFQDLEKENGNLKRKLEIAKKILTKVNEIGITHYEDCSNYSDEDEPCDCGIDKLNINIFKALEELGE